MDSHTESQAEIWDDSLLVDSWNEAVEEYKRYHSLRARGEKVEAVLKEAEKESEEDHDEQVDIKAGESSEQPVDDKPAKNDRPSHAISTQPGAPREPALPQHLIGQVQDEKLKNLLMSWYYAGYYTGLYEGQQGTSTQQA